MQTPTLRSPWHTFTLNMRLFWQGAVLSYIALFRWLRPPVYLASKLVMPLAQILFFTLIGIFSGQNNAAFYIIGNAIQVTAINGIYGVTMSIGDERQSGTLPYLFATPANRLSIFLGRALIHIIDGMLGVVIGLIWGVILFHLDLSHTDMFALACAILLSTLSTSGLGLLCGCLSLVTLNVLFVNNTVYFLLLLFSGANIALSTLPGWIQTISAFLPLSRGITAARLIVGGAHLADVSSLLIGELLVGVVYISLGYVFFRSFESAAKRSGTLEII